MIMCLRLGGLPVTGILNNDHWMELVEQFCGRRPPKDEDEDDTARLSYLIALVEAGLQAEEAE